MRPSQLGRDRAAVVTSAVLQTIQEALVAWFHGDHVDLAATRAEVEEMLRDEFADAERQAASDTRPTD
jgi:hypothetical protein